MNVSEISIPVPWGHIAGKTWGDKSLPPVLCLHGIMDNCSSFDLLIPLLPSSFFYICLDFPGHGLSSHFPAGFSYSYMIFVSSIMRAVNHLNLDKFVLMGHSFGGRTGSLYTSMFPHKVIKLILLDSFGMPHCTPSETGNLLKEALLVPLKVEQVLASKTQPKYKYEELLQRFMAGRQSQDSSLRREAAEVLMKRNIKKVSNEDLYYFTIDQHLKHYINFEPALTLEQLKHFYSTGIKCKVIILESSASHRKHNMSTFLDLKSVWKNQVGATVHCIEGNHDVHLNQPELVGKIVAPFLIKTDGSVGKSKL